MKEDIDKGVRLNTIELTHHKTDKVRVLDSIIYWEFSQKGNCYLFYCLEDKSVINYSYNTYNWDITDVRY